MPTHDPRNAVCGAGVSGCRAPRSTFEGDFNAPILRRSMRSRIANHRVDLTSAGDIDPVGIPDDAICRLSRKVVQKEVGRLLCAD